MTPEYIRGMREVGFVTVSEDQLVRMKIHKVDAQFVRDARADGLSVQTPWTSRSTAPVGAGSASPS